MRVHTRIVWTKKTEILALGLDSKDTKGAQQNTHTSTAAATAVQMNLHAKGSKNTSLKLCTNKI